MIRTERAVTPHRAADRLLNGLDATTEETSSSPAALS